MNDIVLHQCTLTSCATCGEKVAVLTMQLEKLKNALRIMGIDPDSVLEK